MVRKVMLVYNRGKGGKCGNTFIRVVMLVKEVILVMGVTIYVCGYGGKNGGKDGRWK